MAFRWQANNGPLLVAFQSSLHPINQKKPLSVLDPSDKTFWIRTCHKSLFQELESKEIICIDPDKEILFA